MALTDIAIRRLAAREKPYRIADSKGLALLVHSNGSKYWQYRYRFNGKGKLLALGVYPDVTLAEARDRRDEARKQLANGVDPSDVRRMRKSARAESEINSFQAVAEEWPTGRIDIEAGETPAFPLCVRSHRSIPVRHG